MLSLAFRPQRLDFVKNKRGENFMDFEKISKELRTALDICASSLVTNLEFDLIKNELEKCYKEVVWDKVDFRIPGKVIIDVIGSCIYVDGIASYPRRKVIETGISDTSYRLRFENDDYERTASKFIKARIPYRCYFDSVISLWASVIKTGGKFIYKKTDGNDTIEFCADGSYRNIKIISESEIMEIKVRKIAKIQSI